MVEKDRMSLYTRWIYPGLLKWYKYLGVAFIYKRDLVGQQNKAEYKKPACAGGWSGNVLFSHGAAPTVSSELEGLTAVFEMGTGVSLPL